MMRRAGSESPSGAWWSMSARDALRVLVVDDDRDTVDSLAMLLRCWGHEVHVAQDGVAALAQVTAFPPQLMLVDLAMPGMHGLELATRLRSSPGLSKTPLVAVTGLGDKRSRQRAIEAGFDDFLVKPYGLSELLQVLATAQLSVALASDVHASTSPSGATAEPPAVCTRS